MLSKHRMVRLSLCLVVLGLIAAVPVFAGSAPVGSVAGSTNATVGGQPLFPNTILFSGDSLQVKDGLAVVALGSSSRMVFGRNTVASFLKDSNEVTVLLGQGSVSVFHDASGVPVRMKIGDVTVVPVSGFRTLGEVATLDGAVVVTAKDGSLRVDEGNGHVLDVAKGKTITVVPKTNAPQPSGGTAPGAGRMGGSWWEYVDLGAITASIIIGAWGISKADSASNNATSAASEAAAAASAAAAAISAANSAASAAAAAENQLGCALNQLAYPASPYVPPAGYTCPPS